LFLDYEIPGDYSRKFILSFFNLRLNTYDHIFTTITKNMNEILNTQLMHPRDQITMIIGRIYKRGLTTTSGGNISVIDDDAVFGLLHRVLIKVLSVRPTSCA